MLSLRGREPGNFRAIFFQIRDYFALTRTCAAAIAPQRAENTRVLRLTCCGFGHLLWFCSWRPRPELRAGVVHISLPSNRSCLAERMLSCIRKGLGRLHGPLNASFLQIVNTRRDVLLVFFLRPGAGQDVGRSCILVSIAGKNVMLDCGMHMGYNDDVSNSGDT